MARKVILLIEDNASDAALIECAFESWGVINPTRAVKNGNEAIDYIQGTGRFTDREKFPSPNLILLDLNMAELNGFGALGWIRNRHEYDNVPIILLTGTPDPGEIERAYQLGANSFIIKTADLSEFRRRMEEINEFVLTRRFPESVLHYQFDNSKLAVQKNSISKFHFVNFGTLNAPFKMI